MNRLSDILCHGISTINSNVDIVYLNIVQSNMFSNKVPSNVDMMGSSTCRVIVAKTNGASIVAEESWGVELQYACC